DFGRKSGERNGVAEVNKKLHGPGKDQEIDEEHAGDEEGDAERDVFGDPFALVRVEAGGDEHPHLIEHPGGGEGGGGDEADLDEDHEGLADLVVDHLGVDAALHERFGHGGAEGAHDAFAVKQADGGGEDEADEAENHAPAE